MKKLLIVDLSNLIFRAFYGYGQLTSSTGENTQAIHGTVTMLLRTIQKYKPTDVVIALESKTILERNKYYPEYKNNRKEKDPDLKFQIGKILELIKLMGFCAISIDGYEADDVIGSVAAQRYADYDEIIIESLDKDLSQLINDKVILLDSKNGIMKNSEFILNKYGVTPTEFIDYLSLVGDNADNVPGVKGVGPKSATNLIKQFGTLEKIYENIEDIKGATKTKLSDCKDIGFMSKRLVTVVLDLDLGEYDPKLNLVQTQPLKDFLMNLDLEKLMKELFNL